jgi:hypothetical protein
MKTWTSALRCALWGWAIVLATPAMGQVTIPDHTGVRNPNRGSDGFFNPTTSVEVDLTLATTGAWDGPSTGNNGVYDPDKWAIVFKYTKVTIPTGVTVTFKNHYSGAPVVWLVDGDTAGDGDVAITGTVNLDGANGGGPGWFPVYPGQNNTGYVPGGPGGFNGGFGVFSSQVGSAGFGPGGGHWAANSNAVIGAGSHATSGADASGPTYLGSAEAGRCIPLMGGSGGSSVVRTGGCTGGWTSGGAGGGAIFIAARGTITLNGSVHANGGGPACTPSCGCGYGGSGGAVRLVADQVTGAGSVAAVGNNGGGTGRRRIEVRTGLNLPSWVPDAQSTQGIVGTGVAQLWPTPALDYKVKIVSIAGRAAPVDPLRHHIFPGTDLSISAASPVAVVVETQNVPTTDIVRLRVRRKSGAEPTTNGFTNGYINLAFQSHDTVRNVDIWGGNVQFPTDVSFVQAEAVLP